MAPYGFPGPRDLTFIGKHKEREYQDLLVHAVKRKRHQQTPRVAHGRAIGAWRSVHQSVLLREAQRAGPSSVALSRKKWLEWFHVEAGTSLSSPLLFWLNVEHRSAQLKRLAIPF